MSVAGIASDESYTVMDEHVQRTDRKQPIQKISVSNTTTVNETSTVLVPDINKMEYTCDICYDIFEEKSKLETHILAHQAMKASRSTVTHNLSGSVQTRARTAIKQNLTAGTFHRIVINQDWQVLKTSKENASKLNKDSEVMNASDIQGNDDTDENNSTVSEQDVEKRNKKRVIACPQCKENIVFSRIVPHMLTHFPEHDLMKNSGYYHCFLCDAKFKFKAYFSSHVRWNHLNDHYCVTCKKYFETKKDLREHRKDYHFVACEICNNKIPKYRLNLHIQRKHENVKHECNICHLKYKDVDKHIKMRHVVDCKVICDVCGKEVYRTGLKAHKLTHRLDKLHSCPVCKKDYKAACGVTMCINRHKNIRKYKCDDCGKAYFYKNSLNVHRRLHTGEKPYSCKICDRKFYTNQILYKHSLSHNKQ